MKKLFFALLISSGGITATAQKLSTGDVLPQYVFNHVYNYPTTQIDLRRMAGKMIIFDFWGPTCASCLASFPHLDSIQKKFSDKVQVILVNKDSQDSTANFFKLRKHFFRPDLPFITSDTVLHHFFPHVGDPFQVWIDQKGVIVYISWGGISSCATVGRFLSTGKLPLASNSPRTRLRSLFDEKYVDHVGYFSYISKCIDYASLKLGSDNMDIAYSSANCVSAIQLYQCAYNERRDVFYKFNRVGRLIFEGKDSSKFFLPRQPDQYNDWLSSNAYYYQLLLPKNRKSEWYRYMQQDLDRYFDLDAKVIKRKTSCWVLSSSDGGKRLETRGGTPRNWLSRISIEEPNLGPVRGMHNWPYKQFSTQLAYIVEHSLYQPFVDSVNYTGNIDIELSGKAIDDFNVAELNKDLRKYGLELQKKDVMLEVLYLKERD